MAWFVINLGFINSRRHKFHSKTFTDIPNTQWHMYIQVHTCSASWMQTNGTAISTY